jgi:hypothetical protein
MMDVKLMVLADMLHLDQWSRWPLRILINSVDVYEAFQSLPQPPEHIRVSEGPLRSLPKYSETLKGWNFFWSTAKCIH